MRGRWLAAAALTITWGSAAHAADKPVVAPPPAWVKPVALPMVSPKPDEGAVKLLLLDQQSFLQGGQPSNYIRSVYRIQTPEGLAAGNISVPWRPETDTLTVHALLIRRGDQVIDVLKGGQSFTVLRRETNLDNAVLDGVLTANIQPEGLQVGDIVDLAMTVTSTDPVVRNHVETIGAAWGRVTAARAHLRVAWPSATAMQVRQLGALAAVKPIKAGDTTSLELSLDDVTPVDTPKGASPRYAIGRLVEVSDFANWAALADLLTPLFAKAATIRPDSSLQAEVTRLAAIADPKARAAAALTLVEDRTRYVALAMGAGGLTPASADETWSRRFGDCKGKTALLLALLHATGIDAVPVIVSAPSGDGLDRHLPMLSLFNHVLVRATVAGRTYWLDATRTGDASLDRLSVPNFGWGLPLVPGATLVRMQPAPLDRPTDEYAIRLDASDGIDLPAKAHVEEVLRGDAALGLRLGLANLDPAARDRGLRDYWKKQYDFIEPTSVTATFDATTGEEKLVLDGSAKMDWSSGWYETDGTSIGWKADFSRTAGPDRDAPYAVDYPTFTRTIETIVLPAGFGPIPLNPETEVDRTIAGVAYHRHASVSERTFTIERSERAVAPEFPASEAAADAAALRALYNKGVYLARPAAYGATPGELAAAMTRTPATAADFIKRGNDLLNGGRYQDALTDFSRAITSDPANAWGWADRGIAKVWLGDSKGAAADLDHAAQLDPHNVVVSRARGLMAERAGKPADAVTLYTAALAAEPGDAFVLLRRASAYRAEGMTDLALADLATLVQRDPYNAEVHLARINILIAAKRTPEVEAEVKAMVGAAPGNSYAHVAAAQTWSRLQRTDDALREIDAALAIRPEPYIYINRSTIRPRTDVVGRRADLAAARKLQPDSKDVSRAEAALDEETGDFAGAATAWTSLLAATPDDPELLAIRGAALARAGRAAEAQRDFAAASAKAREPGQFNNICWTKATAGVALDSALKDCDAAVQRQPDEAGYIDSRAFTLLRLGRIDEAIAVYGQALVKAPRESSSLWGRAVAWARKGDRAKSDADAAAAKAIDPGVEERFRRYGMTR